MKKYLFIFSFLLILIGCNNTETSHSSVSDFFVAGNFVYTGGFENAGSKTTSKMIQKNGSKFIIENTIDSGTKVQRVYLIEKNAIILVFSGENKHINLDNLDLKNGEIVFKAPFTVGSTWKSKGNIYKIADFIDAESGPEVTVEKIYPNGTIEKIIYQKGFGKIYKVTTVGI